MRIDIPRADELPPLTPGELNALPVFPLPSVVFFPGTALPLQLFEPRYRRMIRDCTTGGPDAMAVSLLEPGWEADYEGQPPIAAINGVGRIAWHESLPDGRYNIVLVGLGRARLEELPMDGRPYRRAKASLLADEGSARPEEVRALLSCASALSAARRLSHPEIGADLEADAPPGRLADLIADRLIADVAERQKVLETLDVQTRIARVKDAVSSLLAELQAADGGGTLN